MRNQSKMASLLGCQEWQSTDILACPLAVVRKGRGAAAAVPGRLKGPIRSIFHSCDRSARQDETASEAWSCVFRLVERHSALLFSSCGSGATVFVTPGNRKMEAMSARESLRTTLLNLLDEEMGQTYELPQDDQDLRETLGLDSVDVVGLVMRIEREFRIRLATEELRAGQACRRPARPPGVEIGGAVRGARRQLRRAGRRRAIRVRDDQTTSKRAVSYFSASWPARWRRKGSEDIGRPRGIRTMNTERGRSPEARRNTSTPRGT